MKKMAKFFIMAILLTIIILPTLVTATDTYLTKIASISSVDLNRIEPQLGYYFNDIKLFILFIPTINDNWIVNIYNMSDSATVKQLLLSQTFSYTRNAFVKALRYNDTHIILVFAIITLYQDSNGHDYIRVNSNLEWYNRLTNTFSSQSLNLDWSINYLTYIYSYNPGVSIVEPFIDTYGNSIYYLFSGDWYIKNNIFGDYYTNTFIILAQHNFISNTANIVTREERLTYTNGYHDITPMITTYTIFLNPNDGYVYGYVEYRKMDNGNPINDYGKVLLNNNGVITTQTSSSDILNIHTNTYRTYTYGIYKLYFVTAIPDTVQLSGTVLSFYQFDGSVQKYQFVSQDLDLSKNGIVTTIAVFSLGNNYFSAGFTKSFSGNLKGIYLLNPSYPKVIFYAIINQTSNTLYSSTNIHTNDNGDFAFILGNSDIFISSGTSQNSVDLYGNILQTPIITISNTLVMTTPGNVVVYQPYDFIAITNLALILMIILIPAFLLMQYTKNTQFSLIFGLSIGGFLGYIMGLIPLWGLIFIGLAILGFMFVKRG